MAIHNTVEQLRAAGGGIALFRDGNHWQGWGVYRMNAQGTVLRTADSNSPWYCHGLKVFHIFNHQGTRKERYAAALAEAIAWVEKTYGEKGPWVGNRMRDKVPERIQKSFPIPRWQD